MKRIIFSLFVFIALWGLILSAGKAKAEVYGYVLKLNLFDDNQAMVNNDEIDTADATGGKLKLQLKVIDPVDPARELVVNRWLVTVKSFEQSGKKLDESSWEFGAGGGLTASQNNGYWGLDGATISRVNILSASQKLLKERVASFEIIAKAYVGNRATNEASIKITLKGSLSTNAGSNKPVNVPLLPNQKFLQPSITAVNGLFKDLQILYTEKNSWFLSIVALVLIILLWFLLVTRRQRKYWGRVIDGTNRKPLANVKIDLLRASFDATGNLLTNAYASTQTDRNGHYSFKAVEGKYCLNTLFTNYITLHKETSYWPGAVFVVHKGRTPKIKDIIMAKK